MIPSQFPAPAINPLPCGFRQVTMEEAIELGRAEVYRERHPTTINELMRRARTR